MASTATDSVIPFADASNPGSDLPQNDTFTVDLDEESMRSHQSHGRASNAFVGEERDPVALLKLAIQNGTASESPLVIALANVVLSMAEKQHEHWAGPVAPSRRLSAELKPAAVEHEHQIQRREELFSTLNETEAEPTRRSLFSRWGSSNNLTDAADEARRSVFSRWGSSNNLTGAAEEQCARRSAAGISVPRRRSMFRGAGDRCRIGPPTMRSKSVVADLSTLQPGTLKCLDKIMEKKERRRKKHGAPSSSARGGADDIFFKECVSAESRRGSAASMDSCFSVAHTPRAVALMAAADGAATAAQKGLHFVGIAARALDRLLPVFQQNEPRLRAFRVIIQVVYV